MNWKVEIIRAKHSFYTPYSIQTDTGVRIGYDLQTAYYDELSDVTVPLNDEGLTPRMIMRMEESSSGDEGVIFLDTKTNKTGLLVRRDTPESGPTNKGI